METGAVKQAYNNEVILLKKNFNQARTHIIHKLTRKAKQLTEKKCPDTLKEKLRRKAELAIKEVLAIKKLKARDIGKFIITHKGKLQDYLNKPQVDNDRACARILLHKSMQDKYNFIRNRFLNVPIKDLFMSRQERLQLKKDERLKKMEKQKKKKGIVVNAEGDWDVEHVDMEKPEGKKDSKKVAQKVSDDEQDDQDMSKDEAGDISAEELEQNGKNSEESGEESELEEEENTSGKELEVSAGEDNSSGVEQDISGEEDVIPGNDGFESGSDDDTVEDGFKISFKGQSDQKRDDGSDQSDDESDQNDDESDQSYDEAKEFGKFLISPPAKPEKKTLLPVVKKSATKIKENKIFLVEKEIPLSIESKIKAIQNQKSNQKKGSGKNKKLNDKILNKKFKKGSNDPPNSEKKVVDPFFVTETGENYLSIAEPRGPDEIKEEHRKGNRKIRRAAMFGHVPKIKPRQDFRQENNKFDRQNGFGRNMNSQFDAKDGKHERFQRGNDKYDTFNDNKKQRVNDRSERFNDKRNQDDKPEKLHPSWEAKKKLSGLLPFQGKKIVFDES